MSGCASLHAQQALVLFSAVCLAMHACVLQIHVCSGMASQLPCRQAYCSGIPAVPWRHSALDAVPVNVMCARHSCLQEWLCPLERINCPSARPMQPRA